MIKFLPKLLLFIVSMMLIQPLYGQWTKEEAYQYVKSKFSNIKSIAVKYEVQDSPNMGGNLKAKTKGKYILETNGQRIICNGKTIWNINQAENKVIISKAGAGTNSEVHIDQLFFKISESYKAESLTRENNSANGSSWKLKLVPVSSEAGIFGDIIIWFGVNDKKINKISFNGGENFQTFIIKNLVTNISVKDSDFEFKPAKSLKIIDIR